MTIQDATQNTTPSEMETRYQKAQSLAQGVCSKTVAYNTTLYPIWIGDSDCFWYERERKKGKEYRLVDANAESNHVAFDHAVFAAALAKAVEQEVDANNLPITDVDMVIGSEEKSITSLEFTAFDKRWNFDTTSATCNDINLVSKDWSISPDGKHGAFVRDFNLWIHEFETGKETALTDDGEAFFQYGVAGSAWGFAMVPTVQACWSENSEKIFTVKRDTREVKELPVIQHVPLDGSLRPTVEGYRVAFPGDESIETLQLVCIDVKTGRLQVANHRQIPVTRSGWGFFDSKLGWWSTDNRRAYFVDMARDYKTVQVTEFDTDTGNTKVLFEETSATHINLMLNQDEYPALVPLPETNELLWFSERSGWGHLYLYDLNTGALKNSVTQGDWLVRYVLDTNSQRREAYIQTAGRVAGRDPYYRDLCSVNLDTGELTELVSSDHEINAIAQTQMNTQTMWAWADVSKANGMSPTGNYAVFTRSRADEIPESVLINRKGDTVLELERADISGLPDGWQWPEPVKLLADDGVTDIYGLVFRPSNFSPDQSYPVVSQVFNTPEIPWVSKGSFSNGAMIFGWPYLDAAAVAELGFIVVQIDGRGSVCRQKSFSDESYGWLESVSNLDDHVAGIKQLAARYPYMDIQRVGITTHNTGGSGGIQGLLQHPDFYKVGVSALPHDGRLIGGAMWGEKFEGLSGPDVNKLYPEMMVEKLQGKLLLINGMLDVTCPPATIFRWVDALQNANKDFDLILLPKLGHNFSGYLVRRTWDYLVQHLLGEEPPKEFKLTTFMDG
ncbi:S9 family peptidase [Porticoccaceae bacterium]|nr:S9 family peptidase [Porticoccaceae bacterium]